MVINTKFELEQRVYWKSDLNTIRIGMIKFIESFSSIYGHTIFYHVENRENFENDSCFMSMTVRVPENKLFSTKEELTNTL